MNWKDPKVELPVMNKLTFPLPWILEESEDVLIAIAGSGFEPELSYSVATCQCTSEGEIRWFTEYSEVTPSWWSPIDPPGRS